MDDFNQFSESPGLYLANLVQYPPSRQAAARLAGNVAASFKTEDRSNNSSNPQTAALYLQAATRHLPSLTANHPSGGGAASSSTTSASSSKADVEAEMKNTQMVFEIIEAVGHAVTQCQPRSVIAQSGILPVLASMMPNTTTNTTAAAAAPASTTAANAGSLITPGPALAQVHVEFSQACIYAGHYAYAERHVTGTWPRPNATVSVRNVLRYFYLRGVVHLACQHLDLAVRCFNTCLCVPADAVSCIALAAWKKLVLIQCLRQTVLAVDQTKPMHLPTPTPSCVSRYINSAVATESNTGLRGGGSSGKGGGTPASAAAAPEDATSIVHLVDNLETGESSREKNKYPALGVGAYASIVQAFVDMDKPGLASKLQQHQTLLTKDGNWGLAHQVASELPCRQLYSWSRVYSSISLTDLANLLVVSAEELERLLVQVSIAKQWPIQVEGHMVSFPRQEPLVGSSASSFAQMEDLVALAKLVQKMDATLSASSKFLSLARKEGMAEGGKAPSGPRGVEDI